MLFTSVHYIPEALGEEALFDLIPYILSEHDRTQRSVICIVACNKSYVYKFYNNHISYMISLYIIL